MEKIVGYAFDRKAFCPSCMLSKFDDNFVKVSGLLPDGLDENGVPVYATDTFGNAMYPIYQVEGFPFAPDPLPCDMDECEATIQQFS